MTGPSFACVIDISAWNLPVPTVTRARAFAQKLS